MPKILGQAGKSLADVYDVEGSQAGIDNLVAHDVNLVHEMGAVILSERLISNIERTTTGAIAQTITFNIAAVMTTNIYRVMGIYVQTDVPARLTRVQVSLRSPVSGREVPFFIWDLANDVESTINIVEAGAAVSVDTALIQTSPVPNMPTLGISGDQPAGNQHGQEIVMRGLTETFGAGTVTVTALIHTVLASVPGSSTSKGLPLPSW